MHPRTVAIVHNPKSGSASQDRLQALHNSLRKNSIQAHDMPTTPEPGSAGKLSALAAMNNVDLVIAFGGDGTVGGCAEGLIKSGKNTPLAIFPGGTGNMLAKSFYSDLSADEFVHMLHSGQIVNLDVISAEYLPTNSDSEFKEKICVVGLSLGWISDVIANTKSKRKRLFGTTAYIWEVIKASIFARIQPHHPISVLSGRTDNYKVSAAFALNTVSPLVTLIARGCNANDGLLDFVVLDATTAWELLGFGIMYLLGKADRSKFYHRVRKKAVHVISETPFMLEIDGDNVELTNHLKLKVLPQALPLIIL